MTTLCQPIRFTPEYRNYVWGGSRLKPGESPVAEAWVVYAEDKVASGSLQGRSLAEVSAEYGEELLGKKNIEQTGTRFPLLIKLLDCAQWLSLQVHPNDEQAKRLEGQGFFGKTEAWHFFEVDPGAEILCGLKPGTTEEALANAIRNGTILDVVQRLKVKAGDSIFIRPGMIHALGPGLLLYEVQQTSDITYRVFDWNRPETKERHLHIEKSLEVADPSASGKLIPLPKLEEGQPSQLVSCPYFTMETLCSASKPFELETNGESFHALTMVSGSAQVNGGDWEMALNKYESLIVPASCGKYIISPRGEFRALRAYVK
jgi:mannose-6-phosphate isomerase